ncbi:MAG: enoyl-CoA hydratase-related protein [Calditrichia bacterium]
MLAYQNIIAETDASVGIIQINRPDKLNALNQQTLDELSDVVSQYSSSSEIGCVIITGSGEKAFVAGADISQISEMDGKSAHQFAQHGQQIFTAIEQMRKPVIAAVNGFALGGGCELALACHIRIASAKARFGLPEINLGIIPGYGGTQRLPRLVGMGRALQMMLSGDMVDAQTALQIGLVNAVVEPADLLENVKSLATKLAQKAPLAAGYILSAAYHGAGQPLGTALNIEAECFSKVCETEDMKEGTRAFLEKRAAKFIGR